MAVLSLNVATMTRQNQLYFLAQRNLLQAKRRGGVPLVIGPALGGPAATQNSSPWHCNRNRWDRASAPERARWHDRPPSFAWIGSSRPSV